MNEFLLELACVALAFFVDHWRGFLALGIIIALLLWCFCRAGALADKKW